MRAKNFLFAGLASLIGIVVALVLAEGAARLFFRSRGISAERFFDDMALPHLTYDTKFLDQAVQAVDLPPKKWTRKSAC